MPSPFIKNPKNPGRSASGAGPTPPAPSATPARPQSAPTGRHGRMTLNTRLLMVTLGVVVVGAPVLYVLHGFQVRRTAAAFLERAEELKRDGDYRLAADYINRYRRLRPGEENASITIDFARTFDRSVRGPASKRRATDYYYEALGVAGDDPGLTAALRLRLSELLLEASPVDSALLVKAAEEAASLPAAGNPPGVAARAWRVIALAQYALARTGGQPVALPMADDTIGAEAGTMQVGELLEKAVDLRPYSLELVKTLALEVYRKPERYASLLGPRYDAGDEDRLGRQADDLVDRFVQAARRRLGEALQGLLPGTSIPERVADLSGPYQAASDFIDKVKAEADGADGPPRLPEATAVALAENAVNSFRTGGLSWLREGAAEVLGASSGAIGGAATDDMLQRADLVKLAGWLLAKEPEAIDRLLQQPLDRRNLQYSNALVARFEYRSLFDRPIDRDALDAAVAHTPEDAETLIAAGSYYSRKARSGGADAQQTEQLCRKAESLLRRAMKLAPQDERSYAMLGELMLARREAFTTTGDGAIVLLDDQTFEAGDDGAVFLHFEGADNDLLVKPESADRGLRAVRFSLDADRLAADYDADTRTAVVALPKRGASARELADALRGLGGIEVKTDDTIDQAAAMWWSGIRATQRRTASIPLRLAETLSARGVPQAADEALDAFDAAVEAARDAGRLTPAIKQLQSNRRMLDARRALASDRQELGIKNLETMLVDANATGDTAVLPGVLRSLSEAYAARGEWAKAAKSAEELSGLSPDDPGPSARAGLLWTRDGAYQRAAEQYRKSLRIEDDPAVRVALARALLMEQQAKPERSRDWEEFDAAFGRAEGAVDGETRDKRSLDLLAVDAMLAKSGGAKREKERADLLRNLKAIELRHLKSTAVQRRLSFAYDDLRAPGAVDRVLDQWEAAAGADADAAVDVTLRRSEVLEDRGQADDARRLLQEALAEATQPTKQRLQDALLQLELLSGESGDARERLLAAHQANPLDAETVFRLAVLALNLGQNEEYEGWSAKLKKLVRKDDARLKYLEAERIVTRNPQLDPADGARARELLEQAIEVRPTWSTPRWLLARLAAQLGDFATTIEEGEKLRLAGLRSQPLYELLISVRCRRGEFDRAEQLMAEAEQSGFDGSRLTALRTLIKASTGDVKEALAAAKADAAANPNDDRLCYQYGALLASSADPAESKRATLAFERCVRLAPDELRYRLALATQHARLGDRDQAAAVLAQAEDDFADRAGEIAAELSSGYAAIGDIEKAVAQCRVALEAAPASKELRLRLAQLLRPTDPDEAESVARGLIESAPSYRPARRFLAALVGSRGNAAAAEEAVSLLSGGGQADLSPDELRLKAKILVAQGEEGRREALRALESIAASSVGLVDTDRIMLASLYEADGRYRDAAREYTTLINRDQPDPDHLSRYAKMLVRRQSFAEADRVLERLRQADPLSRGGAEARFFALASRGERDRAIAGLNEYVELLRAQPGVAGARLDEWAGNLCSLFRMHAEAEPYYRSLLEAKPGSYGKLASCLARQRKVGEALELCLAGCEGAAAAQPFVRLCEVLQTGGATAEHYDRAQPLLDDAVRRFADSVELRLMLANMQLVRGKRVEAIRLYRQTIEIDPQNLLALNNLASLLSESPEDREEALGLVNRAIELAASRNTSTAVEALLLDTKGSILLFRGQQDRALDLLKRAAQLAPGEPVYHLHLAGAHLRRDDLQSARKALGTAKRLGIDKATLADADRQLLGELSELN